MNGDMVTFPGLGLEFEFSRVAFTFFGRNVYWYGIIIACGFLLAVIYAYARCKQFGITGDDIITMLIFAVPISIICARAYYVIFYYSLYNGDFLKMIRISDGGLAIYGGIIGAVATVVVFCRVRKIRTGAFLDLGSLGLLIGQGIGRWGNFANKEAHGGVTDSFLRMGIYENGKLIYVHPTFLYESAWCLLGLLLLHIYTKRGKRNYDGKIFAMYLAWYGFGRFFIEGLRTDSLYLFSTGIRVSQLLAALCVVGAVIYLAINARRPHDPQLMQVNILKNKENAEMMEENNDGDNN